MSAAQGNTAMADVAVIGAGPAGSAAAIHLARQGLRGMLFGRATFPRFRTGESLPPLNLPILDELGLHDEMEKRFIRKYVANFSDRWGARQSRHPFARAVGVKAEVVQGGRSLTVQCPMVVDASGRGAFLGFIRGWYDPAFLDLFFCSSNFLGLKAAIIAVLAAGLFDRRHPWSLKLRIHPLFMPAHAHRWRVRLLRRGRSCLQQLPV